MPLIVMAIMLGSVTSCKKEKTEDCTSTAKTVSDAASAYVQNQSSANCKSYKAALQSYFNSDCFGGLSAEEKNAYQSVVDGLTCPE